MRRQLVWLLWTLGSLYGLWRGIRLALFPTGVHATTSAVPPGASPAPEIVTPTYFILGIPVFLILIGMYTFLGYALYIRFYAAFRALASVYIALVIVSAISVGRPFLPSAGLLALAVILSIGLSENTTS